MKTTTNLGDTLSTFRQSYGYPGGTIHLAPWAWLLVPLTFIWLIYYVGGPTAFKSQGYLVSLLLLFVFAPTLLGGYLEWTLRNQPGRIIVDKDGLMCTLPWKRQRRFRWAEIHEVRCLGRRFHPGVSFWEIRGPIPKERIVITWELKGYEDLLRTIKERATSCQRFDPID